MLVERHFNRDVKQSLAERLQQIAEGVRKFGSIDNRSVGTGCKVHNRQLQLGSNLLGSLCSIHPALKVDIHQDQFWFKLGSEPDSVFSTGRRTNDVTAQ